MLVPGCNCVSLGGLNVLEGEKKDFNLERHRCAYVVINFDTSMKDDQGLGAEGFP